MRTGSAQQKAMFDHGGTDDSQPQDGARPPSGRCGHIPGAAGMSAFTLRAPEPSALPVILAVPHAGRTYPRGLLQDMRHPEQAALRLEDRYVDRLAQEVARETGVATLIAHAPRAMIDLNRAPEDVDWDMFARSDRGEGWMRAASHRARSGLGLIPRRLPGLGEIWRRRHVSAELAARIEGVHAPYHAALAETLGRLRDRWGAALFIDLHSMPPLPRRAGMDAAGIVLGDRFGATCHGSLVAATFAELARAGVLAAHNRPYAGGYALERHADPRGGIHAMQIEIDRSLYLDSRLAEIGAGFEETAALLVRLVRSLAGMIAALGQDRSGPPLAQAAE
jgi:N-formylglutamate amidohydrolase